MIGEHSATLDPATQITCAPIMSCHGLVVRSTPNAFLLAAPALTITFLGTGSGVPSLDRSLACVAVQRQGELFLFDCGEGGQIQYRRAGLGFAPLSTIAISHMHGDHVTGLGNAGSLPKWPAFFQKLAGLMSRKGVTVVNASRSTALTCFPRVGLEEALRA